MLAALKAASAMAQDVAIGQVGPFSGSPGTEAVEIRDGARACLDQVNRTGGVHGRRLVLFTLDDTFDPAVFLQRFEDALARHPVALLPLVGSPTIAGLLRSGLLESSGIVVMGTVPGSDAFRLPGRNNLFHVRASDRAQFERILQHCRTLGIRRIHVIFQDIPVGDASLAVIQASAKATGDLSITSTRVANSAEALASAARLPAVQDTESVIVFGIPSFMANAVVQLRRAGVRHSIFALSYLDVRLAQRAIGTDAARGLGITETFPNPNGHNQLLQRDFQSAMERVFPALHGYTTFQLEGYVAARVLVAGLRRVDGPPTPAALASALRGMGELDLGGFDVNFGKGNAGSAWTDIGVMSSQGRLEY